MDKIAPLPGYRYMFAIAHASVIGNGLAIGRGIEKSAAGDPKSSIEAMLTIATRRRVAGKSYRQSTLIRRMSIFRHVRLFDPSLS